MVLDLPELLQPGDALVFNDTKVIPAELDGRSGGATGNRARIAVTLIERLAPDRWQALARPAKRLRPGDRIVFGEGDEVCLAGSLAATVEARGRRRRGDACPRSRRRRSRPGDSDAGQHAAPALHRLAPCPRRARPERLPDRVRARGGRRRRADRRASFHGAADAGARRQRHLRAFRDACTSGPGPSCRSGPPTPRGTACMRNAVPSRPRPRKP